jgi:hypothetical protein
LAFRSTIADGLIFFDLEDNGTSKLFRFRQGLMKSLLRATLPGGKGVGIALLPFSDPAPDIRKG